MRARSAPGTSDASNEAQLVVGGAAAADPPGAPGTPSVVTNSGGTIVLTWTAAAGSPTAYMIEAGTAPGLSNLAISDVGSATTVTATGVGNGTTSACGRETRAAPEQHQAA